MHYRGPRGEEREKRIENVFDEITSEDFSSMKKETDMQVQEAQSVRVVVCFMVFFLF